MSGDLRKMKAAPTRSRREGLGSSLGYALAGQAFYLVGQLGVLIALARLRGPEAVGEFGLALAVATPIFMIANMDMRTAQAVAIDKGYDFSDYAGVRLALVTLAIIVALAVGFFVAREGDAYLALIVLAAAKACEALSDLAYGAYQRADRIKLVARSQIVRALATLPLFVVLLAMGASTPVALLAQLVVWALVAILLDYPTASKLSCGHIARPSFLRERFGWILRRSAPLGGGVVANALQASVPRLAVAHFLGLEALGLFTAVAYFRQAGTIAANAVSHALVARFARDRRAGHHAQVRRIVYAVGAVVLAAGAIGAGAVYLFGAEILAMLFGPPFARAENLFLLVAVSVTIAMLATLPRTLLVADGRFTSVFWFQVAALFVAVALSLTLVPSYGLVGAGFVLVAVALFRLVFLQLIAAARSSSGRVST